MKPNTKPTISGMPIQSLNTASSLAFRCIRFFKKKVTGMSMTPPAGLAKFIRISKAPPNRKAWRARTPESGGAKARESWVMPADSLWAPRLQSNDRRPRPTSVRFSSRDHTCEL